MGWGSFMNKKLTIFTFSLLIFSNAFSKNPSVTCKVARRILPEEFLDKHCLCGEFTDLHIAVIDGNEPRVRELIESGVRVDAKSTLGETAFMTAVRYNRIDIAQLLKDAGANVGAKDKDGFSALDWARFVMNHEMMVFLERGIIPKRSDDDSVGRDVESIKSIQEQSDLHAQELREALEGSKKLVGRIVA